MVRVALRLGDDRLGRAQLAIAVLGIRACHGRKLCPEHLLIEAGRDEARAKEGPIPTAALVIPHKPCHQ